MNRQCKAWTLTTMLLLLVLGAARSTSTSFLSGRPLGNHSKGKRGKGGDLLKRRGHNCKKGKGKKGQFKKGKCGKPSYSPIVTPTDDFSASPTYQPSSSSDQFQNGNDSRMPTPSPHTVQPASTPSRSPAPLSSCSPSAIKHPTHFPKPTPPSTLNPTLSPASMPSLAMSEPPTHVPLSNSPTADAQHEVPVLPSATTSPSHDHASAPSLPTDPLTPNPISEKTPSSLPTALPSHQPSKSQITSAPLTTDPTLPATSIPSIEQSRHPAPTAPNLLVTTSSPSSEPSPEPSSTPFLEETPMPSTTRPAPESHVPTFPMFDEERVDGGRVSTCIKNPTESVTTSRRTLTYFYVMILKIGSNSDENAVQVQNEVHSALAFTFLRCGFARSGPPNRKLQHQVDIVSISTFLADAVTSAPLDETSCPSGEPPAGTNCILVNAGFSVSYLGEEVPDTVLVDLFEPVIMQHMARNGPIEATVPDLEKIYFLRFVTVEPIADIGNPSALKEENISSWSRNSIIAPLMIAGASVAFILVGLILYRKREGLRSYSRHHGEDFSLDGTNEPERSLEPAESVSRDLVADNQDITPVSTFSTLWNVQVSETQAHQGEKDGFEIEYPSHRCMENNESVEFRERETNLQENEVEYGQAYDTPIAEAMLLTGAELVEIVSGLRTRNMTNRVVPVEDTVHL